MPDDEPEVLALDEMEPRTVPEAGKPPVKAPPRPGVNVVAAADPRGADEIARAVDTLHAGVVRQRRPARALRGDDAVVAARAALATAAARIAAAASLAADPLATRVHAAPEPLRRVIAGVLAAVERLDE